VNAARLPTKFASDQGRIPVLDIGPYLAGDPGAAAPLARAVAYTCEDTGWLCHGNERRIERGQGLIGSHAAATASNHCAAASALKIRSVDREMRWR
jgi:hypothetical protein